MPLFFFLSGYVFAQVKSPDLPVLAIKRFKTIMVPYFVFAVLTYAYWLLWEQHFVTDYTYGRHLAPLVGIFYGVGVGPWLGFNGVLWFLPCLFVTEMFYALLARRLSRRWLCVALIGSAILGYLIRDLHFWLPWSLNISLTSVVFYGFGHLSRASIPERWTPRTSAVLIAASLALNLIGCHFNHFVSMNALIYGNVYLFYTAAISGIAFIYWSARLLERCALLALVGRNSLVIFCIHGEVYRILIKLFSLLLRVDTTVLRDNTIGAGAIVALTLLITVPISLVIHAHLPILVGRSSTRSHLSAEVCLPRD
jgi:fucose 4-O-acetylase-like acetyltransferase